MDKYIKEIDLVDAIEWDADLEVWTLKDDDLENFPAADVAPVVHGRWIYDCDATDWGIGGYICSRCKIKNNNLPCNRFKMVSVFSGAKFCPNCGAKMDLED